MITPRTAVTNVAQVRMYACLLGMHIVTIPSRAEINDIIQIILVTVIIDLPDAAHDVPDESPVMGFIAVTTAVFQIVPNGRV